MCTFGIADKEYDECLQRPDKHKERKLLCKRCPASKAKGKRCEGSGFVHDESRDVILSHRLRSRCPYCRDSAVSVVIAKQDIVGLSTPRRIPSAYALNRSILLDSQSLLRDIDSREGPPAIERLGRIVSLQLENGCSTRLGRKWWRSLATVSFKVKR